MPCEELPGWLPVWCRDQLGSPPVEVLFRTRSMSAVFGLRLADGGRTVVKARADDGRARACVAAQARLAEGGFPCARPVTGVVAVGSLAVHAEEFRAGGEIAHGDSPRDAARCAEVFAWSVRGLAGLPGIPPPNPPWVRWDHAETGPWPSIAVLDARDQGLVPDYVAAIARRARRRLLAARLPRVLGHADFEAHNLRWQDGRIHTVHDWDSLAWQPEAALVGAASAVFAKLGPATLAPIASTEAFLAAYQDARGRPFTMEEREVAWAASLWPVAHDIRWEALHGYTAVSAGELRTQAAERLRRAGA